MKIKKLINGLRNFRIDKFLLYRLFLYFKEIYKANDLNVTGTGVLQLFYDDYIIKVPLGKLSERNLEKEYYNYKRLKLSSLSQYVDYKFYKKKSYYVAERLNKIEVEQKNLDIIINNLEKEKIRESDVFPNISFSLLNKLCNKNFDLTFKYEKGVMHGDLTLNNIMLNNKKQIVLIDLDRFTFNGIKGIDKLHFYIEKEAKGRGKDFFELILERYKTGDKKEKERLFIYFVYRLNIEIFDISKIPKCYLKKCCKVFNCFLKDFEK